jgi:hypothetical protein
LIFPPEATTVLGTGAKGGSAAADKRTRRISVRRRYSGNPWFKRCTLLRHALDVLRKAHGPACSPLAA